MEKNIRFAGNLEDEYDIVEGEFDCPFCEDGFLLGRECDRCHGKGKMRYAQLEEKRTKEAKR